MKASPAIPACGCFRGIYTVTGLDWGRSTVFFLKNGTISQYRPHRKYK